MKKKKLTDDHRLMLAICHRYYDDGESKQAIAQAYHLSRPTVAKLIKTARDIGMVKIIISDTAGRNYYKLEEKLEQRYGLKEVIIVDAQGDDTANKKAVGQAAANYLSQVLKNGDIVGVGWGTTMAAMAAATPTNHFSDLTFIPLNGGNGIIGGELHGNTIIAQLADHFGGHFLPINAPAMVSRIETKNELLKEKSIRRVLALAPRMNVAITAIGRTDTHSTVIKTGYFTGEMLENLRAHHVCGDIGMHFFDENGDTTPFAYNDNIIGVDVERLRDVPVSIGLCCGTDKAPAIRGALRGGFVNVLIMDDETAKALDALEA